MTEPQWQQISPKLATARRVTLALELILPIAALVVGVVTLEDAWQRAAQIALAVLLVLAAWGWWLAGRQAASYRFLERDDDLIITKGVVFKREVIVPYGRMQMVDLAAGPIDRAFGITRVQLHTAAATTDASIPGLTPDIAAAVRDRLAAQGEQRSAGL